MSSKKGDRKTKQSAPALSLAAGLGKKKRKEEDEEVHEVVNEDDIDVDEDDVDTNEVEDNVHDNEDGDDGDDDVAAEADNNDANDGENGEDETDEVAATATTNPSQLLPSTVEGVDNLEYDLFNLAAYEAVTFENEREWKDEDTLRARSRDNVQRLVNKIFSLPSTPMPNEVGRLVTLPFSSKVSPALRYNCSTFSGLIPRALPPPKPKAPTKWELFARAKGIVKKKRDRMVFDEATAQYAPRYGYKRANDDSQQVIIEHKAGDDSSVDPWSRMEQEKKERKSKNQKQQRSNLATQVGEANKKLPGTIDLTSAASHTKQNIKTTQRGAKRQKTHTDVALSIAQTSTASVGKFDEQRYNEPSRPKLKESKSVSASRNLQQEKSQSLNVLSKLMGKEGDVAHMDKPTLNLEKAANIAKNKVQHQEATNKKSSSRKGGSGSQKGSRKSR